MTPITSGEFYATDGADGLGFLLSMMAPTAVVQYANLGAKGIKLLGKGASLMGDGKDYWPL